jgi:hypothetical protein
MHLTRTESESLLCLCSTSSIYYVAIVLVLALLQKPALLLPLLLSHGLTTLCLAATLRHQLPAWKALPVGDSVPLGARLNASVRLATQTNLQLAGWLILASIAGAFAFALPLPHDYALFGLIDPALGASALAKSVIAQDVAQQVVVVLSAVIGFGGLTNVLRLTSDSSHSDIRLTRIIGFKLAHALGNAVVCSLLFLIL